VRVSGLIFSSSNHQHLFFLLESPPPSLLKAPCHTTTNLHIFKTHKPQNLSLVDFPIKSSHTLISKHPPGSSLSLSLTHTLSHTLSHSYTFVSVSRATPKDEYMIFSKCVCPQAQKKKRSGVVVLLLLLLRLQDSSFYRSECRCY
jgi:hypothetical protein